MKHPFSVCITTAALLALGTHPLHAGLFTLSSVSLNALGTAGFDSQSSFSGATSTTLSVSGRSLFPIDEHTLIEKGTGTSTASARTGAGTLGVQTAVTVHSTGSTALLSAKAGAFRNPGAGQNFDANGAQAEFSSSDLRVTPITGAGVSGAGTITAALRLNLDGSFVSNPAVGGPGTASFSTKLFLNVRFGFVDPVTHFQGGAFFAGAVGLSQTLGGPAVFDAGSGLLAGYQGGPLPLSVSVGSLPVGVPIDLQVRLGTITEVTAAGDVEFSGGADFYHTLSLPTSGAVLTLPAGYTADSAELNVSGNSFVAVPEPATWSVVAAAGLAGFAVLRRRRSQG